MRETGDQLVGSLTRAAALWLCTLASCAAPAEDTAINSQSRGGSKAEGTSAGELIFTSVWVPSFCEDYTRCDVKAELELMVDRLERKNESAAARGDPGTAGTTLALGDPDNPTGLRSMLRKAWWIGVIAEAYKAWVLVAAWVEVQFFSPRQCLGDACDSFYTPWDLHHISWMDREGRFDVDCLKTARSPTAVAECFRVDGYVVVDTGAGSPKVLACDLFDQRQSLRRVLPVGFLRSGEPSTVFSLRSVVRVGNTQVAILGDPSSAPWMHETIFDALANSLGPRLELMLEHRVFVQVLRELEKYYARYDQTGPGLNRAMLPRTAEARFEFFRLSIEEQRRFLARTVAPPGQNGDSHAPGAPRMRVELVRARERDYLGSTGYKIMVDGQRVGYFSVGESGPDRTFSNVAIHNVGQRGHKILTSLGPRIHELLSIRPYNDSTLVDDQELIAKLLMARGVADHIAHALRRAGPGYDNKRFLDALRLVSPTVLESLAKDAAAQLPLLRVLEKWGWRLDSVEYQLTGTDHGDPRALPYFPGGDILRVFVNDGINSVWKGSR